MKPYPLLALMFLTVAALAPCASAQCQFARLVHEEPQYQDAIGQRVAAQSDLALITSYHTNDDPQYGKGEVYMVRVNPDGYDWVKTFHPPSANGGFGYAVAFDGDRVAITAANRRCYIYDRFGDEWMLSAELRPPGDPVNDHFGKDVALEGDTVVVTIPNHNGVYVYEQDDDGSWSEGLLLRPADMTTVHDFGRSVAISGDTILVGAPGDQTHGLGSGSAFIFERNDDGEWEERQKLMPDDLVALDAFGDAVAIEGDTAFVGSPGWLPQYVYVYERGPDGFWVETQRLATGSDTPEQEIFGTSLAVCGDLLLAGDIGWGNRGPMAGQGWLFRRGNDGMWSRIAQLLSPDVLPYGKMGTCAALTDSFALLGAPRDPVDGVTDAGSAVFFSLGPSGPDHDGNGMADVCECVGDVDEDGDVDADDLHELLQSWGDTGWSAVDLDGDHDTDQSDLGILLTYYGQVCE